MKREALLLFLFTISIYIGFSQTKDTLYFDAKWKKTTKENHQYFRPLPLKVVDSLSLIRDYYKNGKLQMQGYVYTDNQKKYVGDIYWYTKDGFDASYSQYINTTNQPLTYYHNNGTTWKTNTYKNNIKHGKIKLHNNFGVVISEEYYNDGLKLNDTIGGFSKIYYSTNGNKKLAFNKNTKRVFKELEVLYWMKTGKPATITLYDKHDNIVNRKIYGVNGDLLKHYKKEDFYGDDLVNGNSYEERTNNGLVVTIDSTSEKGFKKQVVEINDVNLIKGSYGDIDFYKKVTKNKYKHLNYSVLYREVNSKLFTAFKTYGYSTRTYSYDNIFHEDDAIVPVADIKEQSVVDLFKSLQNIAWGTNFTLKKRYGKDSISHRVRFKYFNPTIFSYTHEVFDINRSGGLGSFITDKNEDIKKWRIRNQEFFTIRVFLLNGTKPILVLTERGNIDYYIIPTKNNKFIINFEDRNDQEITPMVYENFSNSMLEQLIIRNNVQEFYNIKNEEKKQFIANIFNEKIIEKGYDSIQFVHQYILGRNAAETDIYNLQLKKLPMKNIRQVYHDIGNLQVLANNEVFYIDVLGNVTEPKSISYSFCGTVSATDFTIMKTDAKSSKNKIKISYGGMGRRHHYEEILTLDNLDASYDLKFLNNTKEDGYDGNSMFIEGYVNRTNALIASKNKKFGLYTYNHKNVKYKRKKSKPKKIVDEDGIENELPEIIAPSAPEYGNTSAKEILPVVYDSIKLKDPLIIVEKDNSYGILSKPGTIPTLKYRTLGKVINNFMPYQKQNGEKGWIDVNTLVEFPEE